ncbi:helix-turn-helix domain-containing protein [Sporosarcina sp. resist]|uniref:helix-turn-helix domain-containing protein n=1 Tax=Sporosarcina sp. resist TaxID=2762563 RepID=UPI002104703A|nr:helix-turn-helix domain-containing protein [Sporosarcina sp. resist]
MNVKKKKSGSHGKFVEWLKPEGLIKIEGWARDGLTDEQIAGNIGISRSTLNEWKKKYSDISDTLKRGKEVVDRQVENALLKRALGYQYNEVTQEKTWSDDLGIYEMSVTKIVTKEVNPDTTAQIFWLKNRKPKEWRDKQDIEHSGSMDINNPLKDLSTEDLRKLIDK